MIENHSPELEIRVLENLMHFATHSNPRVQKAMLKLTLSCFYKHMLAEIFDIIREQFKQENSFNFVDILVLIPPGRDDLHDVLTHIIENYGKYHVTETTFENDVDRLIMLTRLRKQVKLSTQMLNDIKNSSSPEESEELLISGLHEISSLSFQESKHGISNAEIAESYFDGKLSVDLIHPTTCEQLNTALNGGIMSKSLITIAAGAGVGKTGFAIYLLDAIARNQPGSQTLFFSLEMESAHIWMRHVGICGGKQFDKLNKQEQLAAVAKTLDIPMQIYDSSSCKSVSDIDFIVTTSRLRVMDTKISVIVVDYLGLVDCKGSFERNDLKQTEITSQLARLAIELDCIVIALSQTNRSPSARAIDDRCPYPSDASGSSGSYFSSTLWIGLDRPELYQSDPVYRNQFVIKCRKNRFGGTFELILAFNDGTFSEVPDNWFRKPLAKNKSGDSTVFPATREEISLY